MPELPEVETTRRGISPVLEGNTIVRLIVRDRRLRWPVSPGIEKKAVNNRIRSVDRRGKYLLINLESDALIIHLGMSGRLRLLPAMQAPQKHDHVDVIMKTGQVLRYTDPRRFGAFLWVKGDPEKHKLLAELGPEPLGEAFTGQYLHALARGRKAPIKAFIMDSHVVVGVGNIYANEALFSAGIHPVRCAGQLTLAECQTLASQIKKILKKAIRAGGTTLRDFSSAEGRPGYFQQVLQVYGKAGEACPICKTTLHEIRLGQRSTVFCPVCQH